MVHLLAITIGLLIALGLESSVEWVHHHHLAQDARQNILQEMRDNQQVVARHLIAMPAERQHLQEIMSMVDDMQSGRPHKPLQNFNWTYSQLNDSAWNAASSTGAIGFMSYKEVTLYSRLYAFQKVYGSTVERNLKDRHDMNVFLQRMMEAQGKLSNDEYESGKRTIQSQIISIQEFKEADSALNAIYRLVLTKKK